MNTDAQPQSVILRPMLPSDLPDAVDLWVAAWRTAYPAIDFEARRDWIAGHIAELERGGAQAIVALQAGKIAGVLVVDPASGYLDQLVVATEAQGTGVATLLLAHALRLSPARLSLHVNRDNTRAIRFYEKHGFTRTGEDTNPRSGAPIYLMEWQA